MHEWLGPAMILVTVLAILGLMVWDLWTDTTAGTLPPEDDDDFLVD